LTISRSRFLPAAVLMLLGPAVCAAAGPPPEAQAKAYLEELWRSTGAPGISVAVMAQGRLVFAEGAGFADLDNMVPATGTTVYNVGSVSKAITAVAILQLVEKGKVALDDPIRAYVPSFPEKGSPITIRHIMTHTSGIRHYLPTDFPTSEDNENMVPIASLEEAIKIFRDDPLLFQPGERYSYSSYAVNLLQGVVETASGLSFEEYLQRNVWTPAGMLRTSFDIPARIVSHRARGYLIESGRTTNYPYGNLTYKFASGGMIATAEDLVRLGDALNREVLLQRETLELMYKPIDPVLRYRKEGPPQETERTQGLLWRSAQDKAGRTYAHHCGTVKGFNACLINYRDRGVVVAIVGNGHPVTPARREAEAFAEIFLRTPEP
jgi:serine beta-lactamase-like protein LACTB, mitochondrial